jgi:hypothetical protein
MIGRGIKTKRKAGWLDGWQLPQQLATWIIPCSRCSSDNLIICSSVTAMRGLSGVHLGKMSRSCRSITSLPVVRFTGLDGGEKNKRVRSIMHGDSFLMPLFALSQSAVPFLN